MLKVESLGLDKAHGLKKEKKMKASFEFEKERKHLRVESSRLDKAQCLQK